VGVLTAFLLSAKWKLKCERKLQSASTVVES
jgi:hypothetical protein